MTAQLYIQFIHLMSLQLVKTSNLNWVPLLTKMVKLNSSSPFMRRPCFSWIPPLIAGISSWCMPASKCFKAAWQARCPEVMTHYPCYTPVTHHSLWQISYWLSKASSPKMASFKNRKMMRHCKQWGTVCLYKNATKQTHSIHPRRNGWTVVGHI